MLDHLGFLVRLFLVRLHEVFTSFLLASESYFDKVMWLRFLFSGDEQSFVLQASDQCSQILASHLFCDVKTLTDNSEDPGKRTLFRQQFPHCCPYPVKGVIGPVLHVEENRLPIQHRPVSVRVLGDNHLSHLWWV